MPTLFRYLILPLMALSLVGLILSIIAHVYALLGQTLPFGNYIWGLHVGIFVIWLPTVLISTRMMRGASRKDFWKIVLRGCPTWMRYAAYGLFGYAILNFFIFIATSQKHGKQNIAESPPADVIRGFSGHWMIFYGIGFCTLFSAYRKGWDGMLCYCPNGHEVAATSKFCSQCGVEIKQIGEAKPQTAAG